MNSESGKAQGATLPAPYVSRWAGWCPGPRRVLGLVLLLGLIAACVGGCGPRFPLLQRMRPLPVDASCRMAVLPFTSDSDYPSADLIVYKVFAAQLAAQSNAWLAQEGDVRKIYQQLQIFPGEQPSPEQLQLLASRLNVRLLLVGHVVEMRETPLQHDSTNPLLAMRVDIVDGQTADTLWSTYNRRQGTDYQQAMHFGLIHSIAGLCRQVSEEIITLWFDKGLTRCDAASKF